MTATNKLVQARFVANTALAPIEVTRLVPQAIAATRALDTSQGFLLLDTRTAAEFKLSIREQFDRELITFQVAVRRGRDRTIITAQVLSAIAPRPLWGMGRIPGVRVYRAFLGELERTLSNHDASTVTSWRESPLPI